MQAVKEKVKDKVSAVKAKGKVSKAKADEKKEVATARSHAERELAHERATARVAAAKMGLHQDKALHREEAIQHRLHKHGAGTTAGVRPTAAAPAPHPPPAS